MNTFLRLIALSMVALFGVFSIQANAITESHFEGGKNLTKGSKNGEGGSLAEIVIDLQETADAALPSDNLVAITCAAAAGGGATEALTCTGLLTTDVILSVSQKTKGANNLALLGWSTQAANAITGIWAADPGAGAVVLIAVKR